MAFVMIQDTICEGTRLGWAMHRGRTEIAGTFALKVQRSKHRDVTTEE